MKISIVMTYYDRQFQLNKTLKSYEKSSFKDFNVVIIDDGSPVDIILPEVPFEVAVVKIKDKNWLSQSVPFNTGFNYALNYNPDIILITEPECYHIGDVLSYAAGVKYDEYISFGCFKISKEVTFAEMDVESLARRNQFVITQTPDGDWDQTVNAWGNHPTIDPVAFHYCCAIKTSNLMKLNGFDERFKDGVSFEDDYFVRQVRNLGLKIEITAYPFVVHQWHERLSHNIMKNAPELWNRNHQVLRDLVELKEYRAKHFITKDLL